jgi:L-serine/L-threonine ammonia-lyase
MSQAMHPLHITTPLLRHRLPSGLPLLLKMENLQPSGSFKLRGIGLLCQRAVADGAMHLVCPSGGNAGFAAAVAGAALGVRTTIVVPLSTPVSVCERIRAMGATVVLEGAVWDEADALALTLCEAEDAVYVPPFDHADIWEGNATLIDEAVAQAQEMGVEFDVVICAVGGGGLLCGVLEGLHRNGLSKVPVIAAETVGAASFQAAVETGELVTLPAITSIAASLGAKRVAQTAFDWRHRHDIRTATVSDAAAVDACLRFAADLRTLVEPACGAALAVAYSGLEELAPFSHPLVVVCGGIGTDLDKLLAWRAKFN